MITTLQDQEVEVLANRLLESPDFIQRMAMALEGLQEPELPPFDEARILKTIADIKAGRQKKTPWRQVREEAEADATRS